jgi:hypothetical protein
MGIALAKRGIKRKETYEKQFLYLKIKNNNDLKKECI